MNLCMGYNKCTHMDMQQKTNAKVLRSRSHQAYLDEVRSDQRELLHLAVNTNIIDERSPSKHNEL